MRVDHKPLNDGYKSMDIMVIHEIHVCERLFMILIYGLINDPHSNLLPGGLRAQVVEHWTGITEIRVGVPFQFLYFQAFLATTTLAEDHTHS